MPDLASLGLAIDSRPAVEAATALDKMGDAAARGEGKVRQIATAADALIAALNRNTAATSALTASLAQVESAGGRAARGLTEVGTGATAANTNVARLDRTVVEARSHLDAMAGSARTATAAWADLGAQGAATAQRLEVARRMATASAIPMSGATTPGTGAGGMSRAQQANLTNLFQQGADVAVTGAMGISPFMIALQQGPQIAQSFAGPGALSLPQLFSSASDKASALAARIGVVGGAMGGLAAATLTAVAAQQSFSATQTDIAQKVSGVGRASGVTVGQINALAPAAAAAGNVSVRSAREMAGEFAVTGRIGQEMLGGLIGTAKDYAATTGQELPDATKALAAAFADPAKGADTLNRQLGFLDASARENIQTLAAQGDRLGAQKALFEAYKGSLTTATELTSSWGRVTGAVGRTISDTWDKVGQVIDRVATGGDLETQIETARRVLANSQARQGYLPFGIGESDTAQAQATLDGLLRQQQQRQAQARQTDLNQRSQVVDDLVKQFNPAQERLKQIEQAAARIRAELREGVLDPDGKSARTATELEASARRIREDLAQGGTQFANAIREAQFGLRTVGFSPQAQRVAGINERAANDIAALGTSTDDPLLRDFQINAIRERQRIELETARQQATISENAVGGVFSRMSEALQQQILKASNDYGRIPAGIIAAIAGKESSGNPNVGYSRSLGEDGRPSSAYGLGQITRGTAEEAVRLGYLPRGYDRTDTATMAQGIAGVLSMKMDQNGGDLNRAIMAYRGSSSSAVNQQYLIGVRRSAGQEGDNSAGALAKESVARGEALQNERRLVEINTQYLGRNGQALEEQTRYQQLLNQAISEGREVTPGLRDELQRMASGMVTASRALRATEAGRSLEFDRDQLGRTRIEQASYGRARGIFGDTTSPMAQAYIQEANDNARLYESKAAVTDAMGGFVTDLRRGTDAASAFSSMLGRLADRALNGLTDSLVSSLFSAGTKGGAAAGSLGGIFASIGSVFGFANGGIMTSNGPLPLRTYAGGGIATEPQVAIYGEKPGVAEAFVPLPDGRRIPVALSGGGAGNANAGPSQVSNIDARTTINAPGADAAGLAQLKAYVDERDRQLPQRIRELQRRAG